MLDRADAVLSFWFGALSTDGRAAADVRDRWFKKDPAFDQELRDRFAATHADVASRKLESWLDSPRGRLAYVIVLDQLSRNMFRGTPGMFAHDAQALSAALAGVGAGEDKALPFAQRPFLYMPFMHSEELAHQERCVALFTTFRDELQGELRGEIDHNLSYAIQHRDIVARFGRFPHRNEVLGRPSTAEEITFLQQPGSSF